MHRGRRKKPSSDRTGLDMSLPAHGDVVSVPKARKPRLRTLEPRMVFDGAGDATAKQSAAAAQPADTGHAWAASVEHEADSMRAIAAAEAPSKIEPAAPPPFPVGASETAPPSGGHEIVFVENDVADWEQLVSAFGPDVRVVMLDSTRDGVEQIAAVLANERDVTAVHIISHGTQGELNLGTARLNAETMQGQYLDELTTIRASLTGEADILVYGCDFSAGDRGLQAAMLLGSITGADIAASTDMTGAARFGADWDLETETGEIDARSLDAPTWDHALIPPVITLSGTNLVANSSFEANANGWTTSPGGVETNPATTAYGAPNSGFGTVVAEVEGAVGATTISTTVSTVIGQTYTFSTLATTRQNTGTGDRGILQVNGSDVLSFTTNGTWQTFLVTFTATSTTTTIGIKSNGSATGLSAANDGSGLLVDNVQVKAVNYAATYTENGSAVALAPAGNTVFDIDSANAASATIRLTNAQAGDRLTVGTLPAGITGVVNTSVAGQITVTLSGSSSKANYEAAIRAVSYDNTSDAPSAIARTVNVTVNDGAANSNTATTTISVLPVNDVPAGTNGTATVGEDAAHTFTSANFGFTDSLDGNAFAGVVITTLPANGTMLLNGAPITSGTFVTAAQLLAGQLTWQAAANANGAGLGAFTFQVRDDGGTANGGVDTDASPNTFSFTVTPVNDAPAGTNRTVSIAEDTNYGFAAADFGFSDPLDSPADTLQAVVITTLPPAGEGSLRLNGVAVTAGQSIAAASLSQLVFVPAANFNGAAKGAFTFQVVDTGGTANGGQNTDQSPNTFAFNITAVNDAPTLNAPSGTQNTTEDTALVFSAANGNAISISDVDDSGEFYQLRLSVPANTGTLTLGATTGLNTVSGNGTNEILLTGTRTSINNAVEGLRYTPTADFNGPVAPASLSFTVTEIQSLGFVNAGFEQPDIPNNTSTMVNQSAVPGWDTSATDGRIEIWDTPFLGVPAFEGDQFAELNATQISTLSQTFVPSMAGSPIQLSLAHRGRQGVDVMRVVATDLGADNIFGTGDDTVLYDQLQSDGMTWRQYTADLGLGTGNAIRIAFTAVSSASGSTTVGNFLDGVSVFDGSLSMARNVAIDVAPVADIVDDQITTPEDTAKSFNVITGVGEVSGADNFENAGRTVTAINGVAFTPGAAITVTGGTIRVQTNGDVTFTPNANFNGTTSFTYTVTTANNTETATATITVAPVNDPPVNTLPATFTTTEDTSLSLAGLSVADVDVGTGIITTRLTVTGGSLAATGNGTVTVTGSGTTSILLTGTLADINAYLASAGTRPVFAPTANSVAPVTLTMLTDDGGNTGGAAQTDTDTSIISITPVNDAPAGTDKTVAINEDAAYTFAAADFGFTDPNDGPANALQAVTITTLPPAGQGTLTLNGVAVTAGQSIAAASIPQLRYTPAANANGADLGSFTFQVVDDGGTANGGQNTDQSANTFAFNVAPVNDAPVVDLNGPTAGTDFAANFLETGNAASATPIRINAATGTVTDVDSAYLSTASIVLTNASPSDALSIAGVLPGGITSVIDTSVPGQITVTLTGVATAASYQTAIGQVRFVNTSENPVAGARIINVTATDDAGLVSNTAVSTITVVAANDSPVNTIVGKNVAEDADLRLTGLSVADPDGGPGPFTVTLTVGTGTLAAAADATTGVTVTGSGTTSVTLTGPSFAALNTYLATTATQPIFHQGVADSNGVIAGGTTTLRMASSDGTSGDTTTVNISVNAFADIVADTVGTTEDTPVVISPFANDSFENAGRQITAIAGQAITAGGAAVAVPNGTVTLSADGETLTFTPSANFNGSSVFAYTVTSGGRPETANITVNVAPTNDAPVNTLPGVGEGSTGWITNEDTSVALTGLSVSDADAAAGTITVTVSVPAGQGSLTAANGGGVTVSGSGGASIVLSGTLADINAYLGSASAPTYQPALNADGSVTLTMRTNDGGNTGGPALQDVDTRTIVINPINDAPAGADNTVTVAEDGSHTFSAADFGFTDALDSPANTLQAVIITTLPPASEGILSLGGTPVTAGQVIPAGSLGLLTFTPAANLNGTAIGSFTFQVRDDGGTANGGLNTDPTPNTFAFDVTPVADPPVNTVPAIVQVTNEDSPLAIPGITVADPDVGQLTTTLTVPANVGSLTVTNLGSGVGVTGNGTGTLVLQGTAAQINDALASLSFTPLADFNHGPAGSATITVATNDGLVTTTSNVGVRVVPVGDIVDDIVVTNEETPLTFNPITGAGETSGADSFESGARVVSQINGVALIPGAPITITGGTIVVAADGTVNFTPNAGYNGTTSFTYTVRSGGAGVADETATVTLTVSSVNDAPSGTDRTVTILENGSYGFSGGDFGLTDLDDTPANTLGSVIITTLPPASEGILRLGGVAVAAGQVIPVGSIGTLTFTPLPSVNGDGVGAFTFQVVDNGGTANGGQNTDQSPNVFRFNIGAVNDVPVANDDTFSTSEDTPTDIDVRTNDTDIDTGDTLTVTAINGTPIFPGGGGVAVTGGTVTLLPSGVLRFTPSLDYNGTGTFTYTVRDSGGATASATVTGTVLPMPDSVANIVPDAQAGTEDTAIVFASTIGNAIRVSDPDGDVLTTTISVPRGTLTLATTAGLIFATGDGTGDATMTFSGSAAAVNAALEGLRYTPTGDFNGATQLTITTSKPPQPGVVTTDTDTVAINLAPVADIAADTVVTLEDTPVTFNVLTGLGGATSDNFENAGRAVTSITQPPAGQGSVTFASDGTLTYTPSANFNGTTSFTYTVTSGGVTETATVTINVAGENDRPTLDLVGSGTGTGYATSYRENGAGVAIADVDAIVADPDGTPLAGATIVITNGAPGDVLSIAGTLPADITASFNAGSFTLTLSGSASAADYTVAIEAIRFSSTSQDPSTTPRTINVTVTDGELISAPAIATVNVIPVNDAPSGQNAVLGVAEDATYSFRPADFGFTDLAEGDAFMGIVLSTVPGNGTMLIGGVPVAAGTFVTAAQLSSGQLTWRPAANANGTGLGSFTFQVRDDGGTADGGQDTDQTPNTISFTVSPLNDPPVAADLAVTIPEDGTASGSLPVATDVDGDPLTYSAGATQPANGMVTVNPDGTYLYTPDPDFNGQDTFSYVVDDGQGGRSEYTVTVTITPVNDGPTVATPIPDRIRPDGAAVTIDVSTAFTDVADGDPLTYTQTGLPPGLTMDSAGRITGTILRDASIGGPNGDGVYAVTITASDGGSTVTDTFIFQVTNPEPTAIDDAATTPEDTPITINVLDGSASGGVPDRDPDGDTLQLVSASAANGTVTFAANGTLTYTPNANFNGTDTIIYTVTDGNRGTQQAAVTVTVTPRNDVPTVSTIPDRVRNDGETVAIDTRSFFTDIDGDTLSFSATNLPPGLSIDNVGRITGQITPGASGPTGASNYTVTVTANDGNGGTVQTSFTIRVLNLPPVAQDDTATTAEDTPILINVGANDTDPDGDPRQIVQVEGTALTVGGPAVPTAHGQVQLVDVGGVQQLRFTPNLNFNGTTTFAYTISDGNGGTDSATVTVTVNAVNDAPVGSTIPDRARADGQSFDYNVSPFFSDPDSGDTLTYSATGLPAGLSIDPATGRLTGTIDRNASQAVPGGVYSVSVTANDRPGGAGLATTQTFQLTVTNPGPTAVNDAVTTAEDTPVSIGVLTNDTDPDGDPLTIVAPTNPADPLYAMRPSAGHGQVTVGVGGVLNYVPDADYNGVDTIIYTISDGNGGFSTASVTVTVTAVNDAPVGSPIPELIDSDDQTIPPFDVSNYFDDPEGLDLDFTATGLPPGLTIDAETGLISGKLANNASANTPYTVTITAIDPDGATVQQTFNWVVQNFLPQAFDDALSVGQNQTGGGNVIAGAAGGAGQDIDPDTDPLTVVAINGSPANVGVAVAGTNGGTFIIDADGSYSFDPGQDFSALGTGESATTTIVYRIADNGPGGDNVNDTAVLTVTVVGGNDAPVAATIPGQAAQDGQLITLVDISDFFSDADGDTLVFSATGLPPGLTISPTGQMSGTLAPNASTGGVDGTYTVTVSANDRPDGSGITTSQTFTYTVTNPAPVAVNDAVTTGEDTPVTLNVLDGTASVTGPDGDPDGDTLQVVAASAANGTVTIGPNGAITYTPNANFNGTDTVIYRISDGEGGFSSAAVTVTVTPGNDLPVATPIPDASRNDGDTVSIDVSGNFSDLDGDTLAYSAVGLPPGLTIDPATGIITGQIAPGASGPTGSKPYSVTIQASDGNGGVVSDTFVFTVDNIAPIAASNTAATPEDTAVDIPVLAGGSDPDGDALAITEVDGEPVTLGGPPAPVANGEVQLVDVGGTPVLRFTPAPDFNGVAAFTYTISDGNGGFATSEVTVTVDPVNDAPDAQVIPAQTRVDGSGVIFPAGAFFADRDAGDDLTFAIAGLPPGLSMDPATGLISGVVTGDASQGGPNGDGVYTVTITATDPSGLPVSSTFSFSITNPPPEAQDDTVVVAEDGAVTFNPITGAGTTSGNSGADRDPDGDALAITRVGGQPISVGTPLDLPQGTVTLQPDGSLTFAPRTDFNGPVTLVYEVSDGNGGTTTADIRITVTPVNDPPVVDLDATAPGTGHAVSFTEGDPPVAIADGSGFAFDVENQITSLDISLSGFQPGQDVLSLGSRVQLVPGTPSAGTIIFGATTFAYTYDGANALHIENAAGPGVPMPANAATSLLRALQYENTSQDPSTAPRTVSITVTDAGGATSPAAIATIGVVPVNDGPVSTPLAAQSGNDGQPVGVDLSGSFSDPEASDPLTFTATGLPPGLTINPATGIVSGTIGSSASQTGPYTVVVRATDGGGLFTEQSFTWTVANPAPIAVDDAVTAGENDVVTGDVTPGIPGQDRDPDGDPLTVASVNGVTGNVGTAVLGTGGGLFTITVDGTYSFDPGTAFDDLAPGQSRTTSVFYTVGDGEGGFATATVTVTVTGVNDAPVAGPASGLTGTDGQPISVDVSGIFSDPDSGDPLTFTAVGLPAGLTIDPATGLITGTLPPDASQGAPGGVYSVTLTARDASGATVTSSFTFTVTNPPPVATDDLVTAAEDQPVSGSVALNDRDGAPDSDPLTFTLVGGPANGSLILNPDGTFTYTPTRNFNGTDTFTYQVSDGNGGVATAQVTITVNPVNDAPVATAPPVTTPEDTPVTGTVTATDPDGVTPTFGVSSPPRNGTASVNPDGTYTYTPDPDFNGTDSFTVVVDDGQGGRTLVTVPVTVTPVNDPPVVSAPPATTPEDTPVSGAVTATDIEGGTPTFALGTPPTNGSLTFNPDGTYTYVPNPNFNGQDSFTVIVDDGQGGRTTVTVPVTVTPVNDAPTATAPPVSTAEDSPVSGFITVTDIDGGAPTFGLASPPTGGSVTFNPDGTYTYVPNPNFNGSDVFTVVVDDGRGGRALVTIPVTVTPVNDAPSPVGDFVPTSREAPTSGNVLVNDGDIDGDPLVVTQFTVDGVVYPAGTVAQIPGTGSFVVNPDGSYLFTPAPGFDGRLPSASYTVSDGTVSADAPLVFVVEPSHQPEFPEPYNPPENPPPTFPPATSPEVGTPIFVDGAVIEAAHQLGGLNSTFAPLNVERPIEVAANALRNLNGATFGMGRATSLGVVERSVEQLGQSAPDRILGSVVGEPTAFDARPFLGGGSHVDLRSGREGGPTDDMRIDTIRKADILYLRLTRPSGDSARVVEYRVTMSDGSPPPAWLRPIAPGLFSGLPPANTGTIDLTISVVRSDGLTIGYSVRLDTATGQVNELEGEPNVTQQRSGLYDRAPTFSEQVRASSGPPGGRAALERALGLL